MAYLYKVGTTRGVRVIACELIRLSICAFRGWPTWARRARSAVRSCCRGTKRYVSMRCPSSLIALNPQLVFILADRGRRRRLHRPCHDRSPHRLKGVSANPAPLSCCIVVYEVNTAQFPLHRILNTVTSAHAFVPCSLSTYILASDTSGLDTRYCNIPLSERVLCRLGGHIPGRVSSSCSDPGCNDTDVWHDIVFE